MTMEKFFAGIVAFGVAFIPVMLASYAWAFAIGNPEISVGQGLTLWAVMAGATAILAVPLYFVFRRLLP